MRKLICALIPSLCVLAPGAHAEDAAAPPSAVAPAFDAAAMEKDLQGLSWPQFKSVVQAIPKLKADVEAYGEAGWQFVRANYMHYGWRRNIRRLDETQKADLSALIEKAKSER